MAPEAEASAPAPFPASRRTIYAKNPLIEVICQLRFPTILRIDSEIPASFQERIRDSFPLFVEEETQILPDASPEVVHLLRTSLQQQVTRKTWKFRSEDEHWEVTLTRDAFALSTNAYTRWEDYRGRFVPLLGALQDEYRLSFITRIGLRYQNAIFRSRLGLGGEPWSALLKPHIAAEYSSNELSPSIREAVHRVLIDLPGRGQVNLRHGTARAQVDDETIYLIDNDFFTDNKTEVADVPDRLDLFNRDSGRLFRWCIDSRLHEAMDPAAID